MVQDRVAALRALVKRDTSARTVCEWLRSYQRDGEYNSIEQIGAECELEYDEAVRVMREIAAIGVGAVKIGRKGWKTRFEHHAVRYHIGEAALGDRDDLDLVRGPLAEAEEAEGRVSSETILSLHRELIAVALSVPIRKVRILVAE